MERKNNFKLFFFLVGLAGLLTACGEVASENFAAPPPDQRCVIIEGKKGLIGKDIPLIVAPNSPAYCGQVVNDYKEAMVWYQSRVKNNSYASGMAEELGNYYTGALLNQARASLFYNQQAGRAVIGRFNPDNQIIDGPKWAKDGIQASLEVQAADYQLLTFEQGKPGPQVDKPLSPLESWNFTLVYDFNAKHWKIIKAANSL